MRFFLFLFFLTLIGNPVNAQLRISEEEKAVFAFFQVGNHVPDYDGWIRSMPTYKDASQKNKKDIYHEQETRLKWGFGTYDHAEDFLKIQTAAELFMSEENEQNFLHFRFPGSAGEEYPYFPYPFRKEWIALVANDLGRFTSLKINKDQAENMKAFFAGKPVMPTTMHLRVRPLSADYNAPLKIDKTHFWIMTGDIAYLTFEMNTPQSENQEIFSYTADWYLSDTEEELLNLLK